MDHSLFPFALMMTLVLLSCAPVCSAKSRNPEPSVGTSGKELREWSAFGGGICLMPGNVSTASGNSKDYTVAIDIEKTIAQIQPRAPYITFGVHGSVPHSPGPNDQHGGQLQEDS